MIKVENKWRDGQSQVSMQHKSPPFLVDFRATFYAIYQLPFVSCFVKDFDNVVNDDDDDYVSKTYYTKF